MRALRAPALPSTSRTSFHDDRGPEPSLAGDEAWKTCREYRILLKEYIVEQDMIEARDADFLRSMYRPRLSREEERDRKRKYLANWHAKRAELGRPVDTERRDRPRRRPPGRPKRSVA